MCTNKYLASLIGFNNVAIKILSHFVWNTSNNNMLHLNANIIMLCQ